MSKGKAAFTVFLAAAVGVGNGLLDFCGLSVAPTNYGRILRLSASLAGREGNA